MALRELLVGHSVGRSLIRGLAIGALLLAGSKFLLVPVRAHGISMVPTYGEGQFIFINRLAYQIGAPQRGDVVAVSLASGDAVLIKRIVALPGERVRIDRGQVVVDDVPLAEPYVEFRLPWEMDETTLDASEVFVIGDNRSMKMHLHDFGRAAQSRLLGRAIF